MQDDVRTPRPGQSGEADIDVAELRAEIRAVVGRLERWCQHEVHWQPYRVAQQLVGELLQRAHDLQFRIDQPLVVATFGGTGTGKSTLVNALVGAEVSLVGRQRPTTRQPVLVVHRSLPLEALPIPLEGVRLERVDAPALREFVLLDCPDMDTSQDAERPGNWATLRRLLPYCDVLLFTSTQQKYASARVSEELREAARQSRLVFVQTHADTDEDIREDWRRRLEEQGIRVPRIFFVDSLAALRAQRAGAAGEAPRRPTLRGRAADERTGANGGFAELLDFLREETTGNRRLRIRRSNLVTRAATYVERALARLQERRDAIQQLQRFLEEAQQSCVAGLAEQIERQLVPYTWVWCQRVHAEVCQQRGPTPFAAILRLYTNVGRYASGLLVARARSLPQLAILGTAAAAQHLWRRKREGEAQDALKRLDMSAWEQELEDRRVALRGFLEDAGFDAELAGAADWDAVRSEAEMLQQQMAEGAERAVAAVVADVARRRGRWWRFLPYDAVATGYLGYVTCRVGHNFFYASNPLLVDHPAPLLGIEFYVAAFVILVLLNGVLLGLFTRGTRSLVRHAVKDFGQKLAGQQFRGTLYVKIRQACDEAVRLTEELRRIRDDLRELNARLARDDRLGSASLDGSEWER